MNGKVMIDFQNYEFRREEEEQITIIHLFKDLFPYYNIKSTITFIILLYFIIFFFTLLFQLITSTNHSLSFIVANLECHPFFIKNNYQIYRIFTSLLLNSNFDSLLINVIFSLMILSFIEKKLGVAKFLVYYFGTGIFGNILSIFFNNSPCISNIGALALFIYSLKLQYQIFKSDNYVSFQNYNQPLGLYIYKATLFSYIVYQYTLYDPSVNFYMYIGGIIGIVILEIFQQFMVVLILTSLLTLFLGIRFPSI